MVARSVVFAGVLGALAVVAVGCGQLAPQARTDATPGAVAPVQAGSTGGVAPAIAPQVAPERVPAVAANQGAVTGPPVVGGAPVMAQGGLTVVGEGTARAEPDVAYVSAGVQSRGATAREAQDANSAAMNQVLARLKGLGIAPADIRTSGVNLQPVYDRQPNQVTGYVASNQVTVTVQDVKRAGEVLDAAIGSGANQSAGVHFGFKDDAPLKRQAAEAAVKSARARADAVAGAAGLRVTGIISIVDEGGSGGGPRPLDAMRATAAMPAAAPMDVPLEPGQLVVTARVQVVYQLG